MNINNLTTGQKIYFIGEGLPMDLIAKNNRYGVVVRSLDIDEDYELIYFQVERGAYFDTQKAFEALKDEPVYSLLDFKELKRAPSDLIFAGDLYDFWSKEGCVDAIKDLKKGEHGLSRRHGADLLIDWDRTLNSSL